MIGLDFGCSFTEQNGRMVTWRWDGVKSLDLGCGVIVYWGFPPAPRGGELFLVSFFASGRP